MCRAPAHTPKQAPSASVACVYHFWVVASNESHSMPLRGVSAVFLVMCLAALRGIDAQRSVSMLSSDLRVGMTSLQRSHGIQSASAVCRGRVLSKSLMTLPIGTTRCVLFGVTEIICLHQLCEALRWALLVGWPLGVRPRTLFCVIFAR